MAGLNSASSISKFTPKTSNRDDYFSSQVIREFNTYSTWSEMGLPDISDFNFIKNGDKIEEQSPTRVGKGIKSIFNKYTLVPVLDINTRTKFNTPLVDSSKTRQYIKLRSNPSIKNLVEQSREGTLGRETYSYSDFMYCKHLGKISNNYLITLRRFPIACGDYIGQILDSKEEREIATSLGCMVTWLGTPGNDIENILSYSFSMPFQDKTAEIQDVQRNDNSTPLGSMFAAFDSKYQQQVQTGQAGSAIDSWVGKLGIPSGSAPYSDHLTFRDSNKVYGPVDVVKQTSMRSEDGLKFNQTFSLRFEYELRSYSNINARQAMLDLLANILTVTYVNGSFWGGGFRGLGPHQSDVFSNLKIMKNNGGVTGYIDAFANDVSNIGSSISKSVKDQGGWWNTIKNLANNFGGMLLGGMLNKMGRPQKQMLNSLLSPAPVGLWHVTIGNPFHPILSIGNMIIDETTITHQGPLGLDDFPTKLIVNCTLKRAKGRDSNEIERMYNNGAIRIYSGLDQHTIDLINSAPDYKGSSNTVSVMNNASNVIDDPKKIQATGTKSGKSSTLTSTSNLGNDKMMYYWQTHDEYAVKLAGSEWMRGGGSKTKSAKTGSYVGSSQGITV